MSLGAAAPSKVETSRDPAASVQLAAVDADHARGRVPRQLPVFLMVGGIAFCADAGLMQSAHWLGATVWTATTLGYAVGLTTHFVLNRTLTFRAPRGQNARQIALYLLNAAVCYALTLLVVEGAHALWPAAPISIWKTIAVGATTLLTFVWLRCVAFRR